MTRSQLLTNLVEGEDKFSHKSLIQDSGNRVAGFIFIRFREGGKHSEAKSSYALNGTGDTWFRKVEDYPKGTKGHGLAIQDIKITSRNPEHYGNFYAYKATMKYIGNNYNDEEVQSDPIWLYIDKSYDLDEVMDYINKNKHNWKP